MRRSERPDGRDESRLAAELAAMERLHELVARLLVCPDLRSALEEVLCATIEITGAGMGNVQLFDRSRGVLEIAAQRGFKETFLHRFSEVRIGDESACSRAMAAGQRVIIEDVNEDARYVRHRDVAASAGYRGVQSTPLMSRSGELLGMLSTHYPCPYRPPMAELHTLDLYARQAADFIDRKRAEELLHESDRRKDEFLAVLAHELRNPLAAIRTAAELLKHVPAELPLVERAQTVIDRQSAHMSRLVDGLLEISRISSGKIVLERKTVDVRSLLESVLQDRQHEIARLGLQLKSAIATEPCWVWGDEVRLTQVFDNLVGNAIKFTQPPGCIEVSARRAEREAVICIDDTGVGSEPEAIGRIFEPFHQAPAEVARGAGGLGLGLALARSLVELHGGTINARSPGPGRGAEFQVNLPLTTPPARAEESERIVDVPPTHILIVEDNADCARMLRDLLEIHGHTVAVVERGDEALLYLRRQRVAVVLCDIGLPDTSGNELAAAIRGDAALADIPLVAVTGYGQAEDRLRAMEAGFDAHLTKPVEQSVLNALLARVKRIRKAP